MIKQLLAILILMVIFVPQTKADRRKYVWTYQYATIAPGAAELEFYQTTKIKATNSWEYRIEVEHGVTERMDFALYQIFAQKETGSLSWDAFQFRTRYKLAEPGAFPLDPLLYLEYRRKTDLTKQNKLEAKLILGRQFDRIDLAINPVYEFFWAPGDPVHEFGLDVGFSYEFSYSLSLGMETVFRQEIIKNEDNKQSAYLGPTLSVATGDIFYSVGYLWGISNDADNARVRLLMGVGL